MNNYLHNEQLSPQWTVISTMNSNLHNEQLSPQWTVISTMNSYLHKRIRLYKNVLLHIYNYSLGLLINEQLFLLLITVGCIWYSSILRVFTVSIMSSCTYNKHRYVRLIKYNSVFEQFTFWWRYICNSKNHSGKQPFKKL